MMNNQFENEPFGAPQKPLTERESAPQNAGPVQEQAFEEQPAEQPVQQSFEQPVEPYLEQSAEPAYEQPAQQAYPQQPAPYSQYPQYPQYPQQPQSRQPQQAYPQQPFAPAQQGAYGFQPEKPLMQQPPRQPQPQPPQTTSGGYDPVQYTAEYRSGGFAPAEQQTLPSAYPAQQPRQPYRQNPYPQQPYPETENVYAQQPPREPKKKSNKGLIIVIIVLSVLLAGSLAGILGFVLVRSNDKNPPQQQESSNNFRAPDETTPDFGGNGGSGGFGNPGLPGGGNGGNSPFLTPETTTEPQVHDESDYSDKVIPDYDGMKLEKKPSDSKDSKYNSEYAFNSVSESVVGIMCYSDKEKTRLQSQGSGIIISQGGYLITNAHVIGNSKTAYAIKVVTSDGKEYNAGVVGFDSRTDLAVLKMDDAKDLKAATFGDSAELTLGEDIIVVGNPGGINYQNSMTKGIVSALDRDASSKSLVKYIQTDAAINPGNSGGPAVNMFGQVIGVASSKIASVTYEGMAFCIPSETVKTIVDSLIKNGYVAGRVKIGISGTAIDAETAATYGVPQGILVNSIDKDGPCGGTKLQEDDIITGIDDDTITNFSDIYNILEKHQSGDKVTLKYYRSSTDETIEEEITLAADQ